MILHDNLVVAFYTGTDALLNPEQLARFAALLSPEETLRMQRFRRAENRHEYLVAHALLRLTLSRFAAVHPADWVFAPQAHGRPVVVGPAHAPMLSFSLSHTEGMVACTVARNRDVGIDVEALSRATDGLAVAEQFFSPAEGKWLADSAPEVRQPRFLQLWTLKEAYLKARGLGLSIPLDSFSFHVDPGNVRVSFAETPGDLARHWQFAQDLPSHKHTLAVAVHNSASAPVDILIKAWTESDDDFLDVVGSG